MKKQRIWIVVASKARARIFSAGTTKSMPLTEIYVLVDPQSRLRDRDVIADRAGRSHDRFGGGRHAMEQRHSPKRVGASRFAARICAYLERAYRQDKFQSLVLVADSGFTGLLRRQMSPQLKQCIGDEIHKNISGLPEQSLRKFLPSRTTHNFQ